MAYKVRIKLVHVAEKVGIEEVKKSQRIKDVPNKP
jgi:hypothetical protein